MCWVVMRRLLMCWAMLAAGCGGTWISPLDAYRIEIDQCAARTDPDDRRGCENMVRNKYGRYLREGGYPDSHTTPGFRGNVP